MNEPPAVTLAFRQDGSAVQVFGLDVPLHEQQTRMNEMGRVNASCVAGAVRMEIWGRGRVIGSTCFEPGAVAGTSSPPAGFASDHAEFAELLEANKAAVARIEELGGFLQTEREARAAADQALAAAQALIAASAKPLLPEAVTNESSTPATGNGTGGAEKPASGPADPPAAAPSPPPVAGKRK